MAITFKHVDEKTKQNTNKPKVSEQKVENKHKPVDSLRKVTYGKLFFRHHKWFHALSMAVSIISMIVAIACCGTWLVLYWYSSKHIDEKTLNMLKTIRLTFAGVGFAFSALLLANNILLILNKAALPSVHVYYWGMFASSVIFPILAMITPNMDTLYRDIGNCLTSLGFMSISFWVTFTAMWTWHDPNSIDGAEEIEDAVNLYMVIILAYLAVVSMFVTVEAFSLKSSATGDVAEISYFRMWSLVEFSMIVLAFVIWGFVFISICDSFSAGYTIGGFFTLAPVIIACVLLLIADPTTIQKYRIWIGMLDIAGFGTSAWMSIWTLKRYN